MTANFVNDTTTGATFRDSINIMHPSTCPFSCWNIYPKCHVMYLGSTRFPSTSKHSMRLNLEPAPQTPLATRPFAITEPDTPSPSSKQSDQGPVGCRVQRAHGQCCVSTRGTSSVSLHAERVPDSPAECDNKIILCTCLRNKQENLWTVPRILYSHFIKCIK